MPHRKLHSCLHWWRWEKVEAGRYRLMGEYMLGSPERLALIWRVKNGWRWEVYCFWSGNLDDAHATGERMTKRAAQAGVAASIVEELHREPTLSERAALRELERRNGYPPTKPEEF